MITVNESYKQDCVLLKSDSAMNQAVSINIPETESREGGEEHKKEKINQKKDNNKLKEKDDDRHTIDPYDACSTKILGHVSEMC